MILFWDNMLQSVYVLYLTRELFIQPAVLGVIFAVASSGGLVGALLAAPAVRWFGLGRTIVGTPLLRGIGCLLIPLESGPLGVKALILAVAGFLMGLALNVYSINQLSLRQTIIPERLQGRVTASMRFMGWGSKPMGALLGGALGEIIGLRATLAVGGLGTLLAFLWIFFSPVRQLSEQPAPLFVGAKEVGLEGASGVRTRCVSGPYLSCVQMYHLQERMRFTP